MKWREFITHFLIVLFAIMIATLAIALNAAAWYMMFRFFISSFKEVVA